MGLFPLFVLFMSYYYIDKHLSRTDTQWYGAVP